MMLSLQWLLVITGLSCLFADGVFGLATSHGEAAVSSLKSGITSALTAHASRGFESRRALIDPSTIPTTCQSSCNLIVTTLNTPSCQQNSCICTQRNEFDFVVCLDCLIALAPSQSVIQTAQDSVDGFVAACAATGDDVIPIAVTGGKATSIRSAGSSATFSSVRGVSSATFSPTGAATSFTGGSDEGFGFTPSTTSTTTRRSSATATFTSDGTLQTSDSGSGNGLGGGGGGGSGGQPQDAKNDATSGFQFSVGVVVAAAVLGMLEVNMV